MGCCDDPTEPIKINRNDVARIQEQYGNLLRDLLTSDPEKVMLKQLNSTSTYLIELAALNAYYDSVRKKAINLLDKKSLSILQRIIETESNHEIVQHTQQQIEKLKNAPGFFEKILHPRT